MEIFLHKFSELFSQLGIPNDPKSVRLFIQTHSPLDASIRLEDAPFWTAAQSDLLREELLEDADWAETIDQLNLALRR